MKTLLKNVLIRITSNFKFFPLTYVGLRQVIWLHSDIQCSGLAKG